MKVAILSSGGSDELAVRLYIKQKLAPGTIVHVDDGPFAVQAAALRQCRCSGLVAVVFRLPGNGRTAIEDRRRRDLAMLEGVDRIVVFGELTADRELTIQGRANVERYT